jgi:cytokinin dehydrogenase
MTRALFALTRHERQPMAAGFSRFAGMSIRRGGHCFMPCDAAALRAAPRPLDKEGFMSSDRRMFLSTGLGATAALASHASGLTTSAQAVSFESSPLPGNISIDADACAAAAHDFGRLIHRQPRGVLKPASSADLASLIRSARSQRINVTARGQGHSIYGRSLAEDGIVIDMSAMSAIRDIRDDRVAVDAGATWKDLFEATLAQGLTPPVLTNYLGLSIGGTVAVGGIGAASSRHGMQTDNVIALDVVTGEGNELSCSATENPDLFDAVRAGLGQCGIVTRATLRLMRAPERVRRFQLFYRDLPSLMADQRRVLAEGRFDQLQGAVLPDGSGGWRYQLDGAVFHGSGSVPDDKAVLSGLSDERAAAVIADVSYREDALAFGKFETLLRSKGQWFNPQPWLLTFLRGSNAERVADDILAGLTGDAVGPFGRITIHPVLTKAFRTPLVRLPEEDIVFVFNLIRIPASNDAAMAERMVAENRKLYDRIREAGGVQYPVGAFAMSPGDWEVHFGSGWPQLREAKRRYDPGHLLAPGYNVF